MKINNKNLHWILLGGIGILAIAFLVIMSLGLSTLSAKSRQLVDLKVKNQTADAQLSNLEQTKNDVEKYSYFKTVAQTVIPNDKNQAQAVLELNQTAAQSGIALQSVTFPTSTLGGLSVNSTSTSTSTATANAATSSARSALSQAKPVSGIPGLYALELTITADSSTTASPQLQVTYPKILKFLNLIENSRRTAQITQVNITPTTDSQSLNFSLVVNIFIKP